jgi:CubicO group peptidase (beta-lactamase class C family)
MIRTRYLIVFAACALAISVALAAPQGHAPTAGLDAETSRRVDAVFAPWDSTTSPGCALGVSRDGHLVYARGYGMANLEYDIAISPESIFHVASISKQFSAFAVALLAADGKLSLDDEVRTHVPELPDFGRRITVRHLMHHTSGLRDQWTLQSYAGWREDDVITEADILQMASRQRGLNFDPGAEYLYSNTGFTLLAVIVKRVSGQSLGEFADARIFQPLGMTRTHFHNDHTMIVRNRTSAYQPRSGGGWRISIPVFDTDGATSLFTTVGDLLKWEQNFADARVGNRALVDEAQVSGRLNDGTPVGYGWGLAVGTYRGLRVVGHGGADAGYRSDVVRFPDHGLAIAAFCNLSTTNPGELTRQVADILLPAAALSPLPTAVTVETDALQPLAGVYWNPATDDIRRVIVAGGALRTSPTAPALIPVGDGRFRGSLGGVGELVFPRATRPSDQELHVLSPPLQPAVFKRLPPAPASVELTAFAGRYYSSDLAATYEVVIQASALAIKRPRIADLRLEPVSADQFAGASGSPTVTFQRSGSEVTGMTISMGRVRRLPFERVGARATDVRR